MARTYNQFYAVLNAIKRCFSRSPMHRAPLEIAKHRTEKGKRGGARYICKCCEKTFAIGSVQVDHIEPVVPVDRSAKDMSYDEIVARVFCEPDNLQVMCKLCHKEKSREENKERRRLKNA